MAYDILNKLEPQCFFKWFGELCGIPHGSHKEAALMDYIKQFAEERGYEWYQDEALNVFFTVPASAGCEDRPAVLLQAHCDMVWAKEDGIDFDFENSPLRLRIEDGRLTACGTTLGADNGVGVATMLALADTQDIPHPPLELLFTSAEEVGLVGIRSFDMSRITARRMINMDCGDTDALCISSAGSIKNNIEKQYDTMALPEGWAALKLVIDGGIGGHSGLMIGKERMCAVNAMGTVLDDISCAKMLGYVKAGSGAIVKKCTAVIAVPADMKNEAAAQAKESFALVKKIYEQEDPDIFMTVEDGDCVLFLGEEDSEAVLSMLHLLHTGPFRRNGELPDNIITSAALGGTSLEDGRFFTSYNIRSANDKCGEMLYRNAAKIAGKYGFDLVKLDQYSGWPERPVSGFREAFIEAYKARVGNAPEFERVHGGIEVGMIVGAIPDMDAVGYAPTAHGAHTPKEYLEISAVQPYWDVLTDVLAEK